MQNFCVILLGLNGCGNWSRSELMLQDDLLNSASSVSNHSSSPNFQTKQKVRSVTTLTLSTSFCPPITVVKHHDYSNVTTMLLSYWHSAFMGTYLESICTREQLRTETRRGHQMPWSESYRWL